MSHYIEKVTVSLENLISELARNPSLFLKNPDTDFSRNRKINFKTCVGITMNSGGCTLNKELLDFFDFDVNAPTVSAYTQQRAKILPEAFEYLFHAFTEENAQTKNLYGISTFGLRWQQSNYCTESKRPGNSLEIKSTWCNR